MSGLLTQEELSALKMGDLQALSRDAKAELIRRFDALKATCTHPAEFRGYVESPRPPNINEGCGRCLTPIRDEGAYRAKMQAAQMELEEHRAQQKRRMPWWKRWQY